MPGYEGFLIAPFTEGLNKKLQPWLTPDEAFVDFNNVYIDRGVIKKRKGSTVFGQLGTRGTKSVTAAPSQTTRTGTITLAAGTEIIPYSLVMTFALGIIAYDDGNGGFSGAVTAGSIDYESGVYSVTLNADPGAGAGTGVYHYSDETGDRDVRGIHLFNKDGGAEELLACDSKRLNRWNETYTHFENVPNAIGLTYGDVFNSSNLTWGAAWAGYYWLCQDTTGIFIYEGTAPQYVHDITASLQYGPAGTDIIVSARCVLPFKGRLLFFNIKETAAATPYSNRVRWSQAGNPLDTNAWRDDIDGRGDYSDASTSDEIITVLPLEDRIIVFFENSIQFLVYTGNPDLPFSWQKINTTFRTDSIFGKWVLDKVGVSVGKYNMTVSDGQSAQKANEALPHFTFNIDYENINKCYGFVSQSKRQAWLAYPPKYGDGTPTKVLVYSFDENVISTYDFKDVANAPMVIKCLEQFNYAADATYTDLQLAKYWPEITSPAEYADYADYEYFDLMHQSGEQVTLAGSTDGRVYLVDGVNAISDNGFNYNFYVVTKDFNPYADAGKQVSLGWVDFLVSASDTCKVEVKFNLGFGNGPSENLTATIECDGTEKRVWKRAYCSTQASVISYSISHNEKEVDMTSIFKLHAHKPYFKSGANLI